MDKSYEGVGDDCKGVIIMIDYGLLAGLQEKQRWGDR